MNTNPNWRTDVAIYRASKKACLSATSVPSCKTSPPEDDDGAENAAQVAALAAQIGIVAIIFFVIFAALAVAIIVHAIAPFLISEFSNFRFSDF